MLLPELLKLLNIELAVHCVIVPEFRYTGNVADPIVAVPNLETTAFILLSSVDTSTRLLLISELFTVVPLFTVLYVTINGSMSP